MRYSQGCATEQKGARSLSQGERRGVKNHKNNTQTGENEEQMRIDQRKKRDGHRDD